MYHYSIDIGQSQKSSICAHAYSDVSTKKKDIENKTGYIIALILTRKDLTHSRISMERTSINRSKSQEN